MSARFHAIFQGHKEMSVRYDPNQEAIWTYFKTSSLPCFSPAILKESIAIQKSIINYFHDAKKKPYPIRYVVMASQTPGIFNLGGDLNLMAKLVADKNRDGLLDYATACIDICYLNTVSLNLPVTTISLVEGSAIGGGMESAISSNVLIAEEHTQMGMPEIRFNLIPGMGAYTFIEHKAGTNIAQEMLKKGNLYTASELHDYNIVDVIADSGKGYEAVSEYISKQQRTAKSLQPIERTKRFNNPITYDELKAITKTWVDKALRLSDKDIRIMQRIVKAQNRRLCASGPNKEKINILRTKQDRRFDSINVTFPLIDSYGNTILYDRRKMERRIGEPTDVAI